MAVSGPGLGKLGRYSIVVHSFQYIDGHSTSEVRFTALIMGAGQSGRLLLRSVILGVNAGEVMGGRDHGYVQDLTTFFIS